jgi:NAD(P)-dependent dehydrogenase (short-subunit alcohol dehydrogenase family)
MQSKRIALVTGANQGVGLRVAKELVANGVTVLVGSQLRAWRGCGQRDRVWRHRAPTGRDGSGLDRYRGGTYPQGVRPPRPVD